MFVDRNEKSEEQIALQPDRKMYCDDSACVTIVVVALIDSSYVNNKGCINVYY
mgnify:CR=1 FL=1